MVRSVFRFGFENGLLEKPIRFGVAFRKPLAEVIRQARIANGPRLFTPEEVQRALEHASPNMRAMVLLALNGGLGNTDLALLPIKAIDLKAGWLDDARSKTAIMRRIPLWPETVHARRARYRIDPDDLAAFEKRRTVVPAPAPDRQRRKQNPNIIEYF